MRGLYDPFGVYRGDLHVFVRASQAIRQVLDVVGGEHGIGDYSRGQLAAICAMVAPGTYTGEALADATIEAARLLRDGVDPRAVSMDDWREMTALEQVTYVTAVSIAKGRADLEPPDA